MKLLLVLASFVTLAYAGVGIVTPEIEAEALRLWAQYCGEGSEGGTDGNSFIYCKRSRDNFQENLQHTVALKPAENPQDQIVFVQPPSYNYLHTVTVTGGGGAAPRTKIFVKPAKNTNEVNIIDQTSGVAAPQKPQLFFLKGSHGEKEIESQPQPTPPPQEGYNYEVPARRLRY